MPLDWCRATTAAHRSNLSTFRCADPDHSTFDEESEEEHHDFPWEIEVQEFLNGLRVPFYPPDFLLLGYDGDRLAVVLKLQVKPFDRYCWVGTVAVANWAKGHGYAVEALTDVVHLVMDKYDIADDYVVQAYVDRDNDPSQRAFTKAGFNRVSSDSRYETWARQVP